MQPFILRPLAASSIHRKKVRRKRGKYLVIVPDPVYSPLYSSLFLSFTLCKEGLPFDMLMMKENNLSAEFSTEKLFILVYLVALIETFLRRELRRSERLCQILCCKILNTWRLLYELIGMSNARNT